MWGRGLPEKNQFHFYSTDDRVEAIGRWIFGDKWEAPQTARELEVLLWFRPGPRVGRDAYPEIGAETSSSKPPALEDWILPIWIEGEQKSEAENARRRAFNIRRQLAEMEELLRHHDKYEKFTGPIDFIPIDPGDDREKLRKIRGIIGGSSQTAADVKPPTPAPEPDSAVAAPASDTRKHDGSKASNKAEQDCKEWLVDCAADHPEKHPDGTKDEVAKAAMKKFVGLSRRGFERAWGEVVRDCPVRWHKRKRSGTWKRHAVSKKSLHRNRRTD